MAEVKPSTPNVSDLRLADRIYRYPAKMTPKLALGFMRQVIEKYDPDEDDLRFYDPMCGSGTTGLIARGHGMCVGMADIMPPSVTIARAKLNRLGDAGIDVLNGYLEEQMISRDTLPTETWATYNHWFTPRVLRALQDIRDAIARERRNRCYPHLVVALYRTIWDVSAADRGVIVPTRGRYFVDLPRLRGRSVQKLYRRHLRTIIRAQEALSRLNVPKSHVQVRQGNALERASWPGWRPTVLLSSPPYGCGLDYPRAFKLQMRVMNPSALDSTWSRQMLGRRANIAPNLKNIPAAIRRSDWFENLSRKSPERSSALSQYLNDLLCFIEIATDRMADNGTIGIVIGNPEMQKIRVPLNVVVSIMAKEAGLFPGGETTEDRIKSRVQNLKLRSATSPIQSESVLVFTKSS